MYPVDPLQGLVVGKGLQGGVCRRHSTLERLVRTAESNGEIELYLIDQEVSGYP